MDLPNSTKQEMLSTALSLLDNVSDLITAIHKKEIMNNPKAETEFCAVEDQLIDAYNGIHKIKNRYFNEAAQK